MINFFGEYSGTELLIVIVAFLIAILFALSIHEFSHGLIALTQGDRTAQNFGRVTLNPFKHIDPVGFLCLVLFGFGWAKPVPINSYKFKNYKKGLFLTSVAGVCANFIACFVFVGLFVLCFAKMSAETLMASYLLQFLYYLLTFSISINLGLAIFNMIPIPPLDGFNVLLSFTKGTNKFMQVMSRYGSIILIVLLIFDVINLLFGVVYGFVLPAFSNFWQFIFLG